MTTQKKQIALFKDTSIAFADVIIILEEQSIVSAEFKRISHWVGVEFKMIKEIEKQS